MAVNLNALAEVQTVGSNQNMLLFGDNNVATRIDYDKLAEAILNKTRDEIGGVSPISAIATLNGRTLYQGGGNINSDNVDSLTTPAIYSRYIEANSITGVSGVGAAFGLFIVTNSSSAARVGQYIFMPHTGYIACRYMSGTTWSQWRGMQMPVLS